MFVQIVSKTATILEKSLSAAVSRVQQTLRDKFTVQNFSSVIENCVNEVFRTVLIDSMLPKFETVSHFIDELVFAYISTRKKIAPLFPFYGLGDLGLDKSRVLVEEFGREEFSF